MQEPEYILADWINTSAAAATLSMAVYGPTACAPLEITYPEDAALVAALLLTEQQS
jgi:hypothetical protein